jgi:hypothetical protein
MNDPDASGGTRRLDDYSPEIAVIVSRFQMALENMPDCNYEALRDALRWSRQTYLPVTMSTLCTAYCIALRASLHHRENRLVQ